MKIKFLKTKQVGTKKSAEGKGANKVVPVIYKPGDVVDASKLPEGWATNLIELKFAEEAK